MTTPPHLDDALLSARADHALDAAEEQQVSAHLATCGECAERLGALTAARDLLAAPVAAVDDMTRRRLVRRALEADSRQQVRLDRLARPPRWLMAAAALAVVFGVAGFVVAANDGGSNDARLAAGIPGLPLGEEFVALGVPEMADPAFLRATLEAAESGSTSAFVSGGSAQSAGGVAGGGGSAGSGASPESDDGAVAESARGGLGGGAPSEPAPGDPKTITSALPPVAQRQSGASTTESKEQQYEAIARCYAALTDQLPPDGRLTVAMTGTYQSRPAIALGFRTADGQRLLAIVLDRSDCGIITAQSYR